MSESVTGKYHFNDTAKRTLLASGVTAGDGSIELNEATNLPSTPFLCGVWGEQTGGEFKYVEDDLELMKVTAVNGSTLTVDRGVEGTAAQSFDSGDLVQPSLQTAKVFDPTSFLQTVAPSSSITDSYTSGAAPPGSEYAGGVLSRTGSIILVPFTTSKVATYDPDADTTNNGASVGSNNTYFGGALTDNGDVVLVPKDPSGADIRKYRPSTDSIVATVAHGEGGQAFGGAAKVFDGRIVLAPQSSSSVGIFDPSDDTYVSGPTHGHGVDNAFQGAVTLEDGRVALIPDAASNVGLFDPKDDSYTDGPSSGGGFIEGVRLEDDRVVFVPFTTSAVEIFDPDADTVVSGPTHGQGSTAFWGGALAPDGRAIFAPQDSDNVGIFDPSDDSYTSGATHGVGSNAFQGAASALSGKVVFVPGQTQEVGVWGSSVNLPNTSIDIGLNSTEIIHVDRKGETLPTSYGPVTLNIQPEGINQAKVQVIMEHMNDWALTLQVDGGTTKLDWIDGPEPTFSSKIGQKSVFELVKDSNGKIIAWKQP